MRRAILLGAASLLPLATPAFAQTPTTQAAPAADTSTAADDGVIVVEARRRDETLQDVPLTVNAVTSETMAKLNLRNFQDIATVVPGLNLTPNANGVGSSSSLRGVNQDVNASGENGTVQFYFADAPVASNFVLQAMYDLGQVEVLRGPQGTLRGRSTPSGSITVAPRRPDLNQAGATISGTYASDEVHNLQFGLNIPVIEDKLAVRVAGLDDFNRGNRIRSINSNVDPRSQTQSIRATVRAEPTDWLHGGFTYEGLLANSTQFDPVQSVNNYIPGFTPTSVQSVNPLPAGTILASAPLASTAGNYGVITPQDRKSIAFTPRSVRQSFHFYGWNASVDFAGQSLIYVGSHLDSNFRALTNSDNGNIFPSKQIVQDTGTIATSTSHEVRLQNQERVAGFFDYVVGYFNQKSSSIITVSNPSLIRGFFPVTNARDPRIPVGVTALNDVTGASLAPTPIYGPYTPSKEESFFGNVVAHVGEKLEVSGGLRYVKFENQSRGLFIGCTPGLFAGVGCGVPAKGSDNNYSVNDTIYNASIRYRVTDDVMVYAMSGSSFRPPVRAVGDFSTQQTTPLNLEQKHTILDAEKSQSYEIGLKSQWFDRKLTLNLTGYHQDFTNYPYRAAQGVYFINVNSAGQQELSQFNFVSAVPVSVNGVESEISFTPSRQFRVTALTNYAHSKIKASQLACVDLNHDGIPDTGTPTLAQLQAAYGAEHLAECPSNGQSASFLPEWSGSVQAEYTQPLNDRYDGYLRGLVNWKGKTKNDPFNPYDDIGAYGIFNVYAGVRAHDGSWEITGFVKNLFDTTKILTADGSPNNINVTYVNLGPNPGVSPATPFGSANYQSNYSNITLIAPREFGITARFSFGSR